MKEFAAALKKIDRQQRGMVRTLKSWVGVNSWSDNPKGLEKMAKMLKKAFSGLGKVEEIALPVGKALRIRKRPKAPVQIFLGGHMDTVFPPESPFQKAEMLDEDHIRGPGAADMKGGLLVMLTALEAFESSPHKESLGWQVIINPDEEIGSPHSAHLFTENVDKFNAGLLFEPTYPDGALVSARKGSANFTLEAKGKAVHAGRDFFSGKNTICSLSKAILDIHLLSDPDKNITVNIGKVEGGGPINIVPNHAQCHFNIRAETNADLLLIREALAEIVSLDSALTLRETSFRPPQTIRHKNRRTLPHRRSLR